MILVTGGRGFLGGAIVRLLSQQGEQVRSLARHHSAELDAIGVEQFIGDLTNQALVDRAVRGCDLVFHVAAKAGVWGRYGDFYRSNVIGTQNVITACRKIGVTRLVYTSSPSVVFDGTDMGGVNESIPYPHHFHASYPQTKAQAEQLVLAANGDQLATVALRPHLIWGPGDNHLVPRILERGRSGQLRRIGKGDNLIDAVYIDNAATAHLQAAQQLAIGSRVAGKAYFIANNEPIPLWDLVNQILAADNLPPVTRTISPRLAYLAGAILEIIYKNLRLAGEPRMTRFVARELATAHWFDLSAAQRDFGYLPQVSIEEGMARLRHWLQQEPLGGR
ncbi:NAD-dependent epimerase/dehydratase family protein [Pelovirga terrestris]|uniref:NAD-dependent epimerase/dehydratase family protein n=1 Tax=Pelovirga terrestris TaxID=2771352 RepID=A0A8J6QVX1_9BACT|nr:NAD-dependent epimerase/dehydratase family protein [Pelovirga terrestris]MBD1399138.1 NAD-dependent epimerase/dehydratase family protein [Pelovirga terrestris]